MWSVVLRRTLTTGQRRSTRYPRPTTFLQNRPPPRREYSPATNGTASSSPAHPLRDLPPPPPPPPHTTHSTPQASTPPHSPPPPPPHRRPYILTYHDLEEALRRRGYSLYRLLLASVGSVVLLVAVSWSRIKIWGAQESAEVASKTLEDEALQQRASELAKQVARSLLSDDETRSSLKRLLESWMKDPAMMDMLAGFLEGVVASAAEREDVKAEVAAFVAEVLTWEVVQERTAELAVWVTQQPAVIDAGREYLKVVLGHEYSRQVGKEYAGWALTEALRAESTRKTTQQGLETILADAGFRRAAGDALWSAAKSGLFGMWRKDDSEGATSDGRGRQGMDLEFEKNKLAPEKR